MALGENQTSGDYLSQLKEALNFTTFATDFGNAIERLTTLSAGLNKTFGQSRGRITEIQTALADAVPRFTRLGGDITQVEQTMAAIALASRRNVVATTEQTEKLFAAMKVTNQSVEGLVTHFADVGVGLGQMGKQLESSIGYIRSIGGNTEQVFRTVTANMDQLNRYQFEGGVAGLTKMAAQASMLRFEMSNTFALAEKVLSPEGAIETAAAFQRLGVSVGNLADPFQLMNQSINDPSGLQDSLAKVSQQFTYFDDKTKTFKVNPEGVLILREMEKSAGLAGGSLSKMGLAAAELNKRVSEISPEIKFKNEEDKQYLTNIAKMGDKGNYIVELEDGTKKDLSQLNQKEFDKLIDQQKNSPKSLEEIAKSQMTISETVLNNVKAIKDAVVYGSASPKKLLEGLEGASRIFRTITGEVSKRFKPEDSRKVSETAIEDVEGLVRDIQSGKGGRESLANLLDKVEAQTQTLGKEFKNGMSDVLKDISGKLGDRTAGERLTRDYLKKFLGEDTSKPEVKTIETKPALYNQLLGGATTESLNQTSNEPINVNHNFKPLEIKLTGNAADKIDREAVQKQISESITKAMTDNMTSLNTQILMANNNKTPDLKPGPVTAPYKAN
jgi:hypothetical protein